MSHPQPLLRRPGGQAGRVLHITPENAGWTYVGFDLHHLSPGDTVAGGTAGHEVCLVPVTGSIDVEAGGTAFPQLGGRATPFEGKPSAAYVPAGTPWRATARDAVVLAVCSAPGEPGLPPRRIDPATITPEWRGQGSNRRLVHNILPEGEPASSLLVVEVVTPSGHWSSYPPHKHDRDAYPAETLLEETYYHRLHPPQGFAMQRVYTDARDIDEVLLVQDGDCVLVPRGYHPVGAPHGYDLYYLNVMAGPRRAWRFHNDPAHAWILGQTA
ncbi:5-deoxy-glucuronate isomerase [Roseomonas sp. GC11]|uniref:5-deoxy-glucuronate isomerase n=1 Tax=Roseomonas sp. GC11 TaxID=2950546 RepID=UPI00210D3B16|nr:5-deoxy-glucuronate isomerase [Roseomonas sp. GC11]MCQ4162382.1 5-deoxy-glucuronate isomerase [Roseomonas sp. GC11]